MSDIRISEAPQESLPKCPYCRKELNEIWSKSEGLGLAARSVCLCVHTAGPCWPMVPGGGKGSVFSLRFLQSFPLSVSPYLEFLK